MTELTKAASTSIYAQPEAVNNPGALEKPVRRFKEPFSGFSHLLAAFASLAGGAWLALGALAAGQNLHALGFGIFTLGLVLLYSTSGLYHLLILPPAADRWLRRLDHMMIYVLIAGTYTPFCLVALPGAWGTGILIAVWTLALAGICLALFYLDAPRFLTVGIYIAMGWLCLVAIRPLAAALAGTGMFWLALGGITYTLGALVYALKKPNPFPGVFGFHEIWHLFVIGGSLCHFCAMLWI